MIEFFRIHFSEKKSVSEIRMISIYIYMDLGRKDLMQKERQNMK